jgi:hypothetical protein
VLSNEQEVEKLLRWRLPLPSDGRASFSRDERVTVSNSAEFEDDSDALLYSSSIRRSISTGL